MPSISEIKSQYPDLSDATDDQVVDALHQAFYSDLPREQIAAKLGVKTAPPPDAPSGTMRRLVGDSLVSAGRGVIGVPEALTGMADLVSGGRAGKALQDVGVDFKRAKDILGDYYSPEQKAANEEVGKAEGFFPTVAAMARNPSTIVQQSIESAPSMLAGGAVSRGVLAVAPRIGAIAAGALGEGATAAGQNAEQVRQEDPSGTLTGTQSAVLGASGLLTGGIGLGAGQVANKLGVANLQTMLAQGKLGVVGKAAMEKGASKGMLVKAVEGGLTEGVLQELPQSAQEQVAQNIAQGKPWSEGVASAGAQGMMAGGLMGAVGGTLEGGHQAAAAPADAPVEPGLDTPPVVPTAPAVGVPPAVVAAATGQPVAPLKTAGDLIRTDLQPGSGPLTRAVNAGVETAAQNADAALPAPEQDIPHPPRPLSADQLAAIRNLEPDQQEQAAKLGALGNDESVVPGVRRYAQAKLDAMLGTGEPLNPIVDDPKTGEPILPKTPTVAAPKAGSENDQVLAQAESQARQRDADAAAQREADRPPIPTGEPQDGDILNGAGKPFTTMPGAQRALAKAGDGHGLVRVAGGLVVRKAGTVDTETGEITTPESAAPSTNDVAPQPQQTAPNEQDAPAGTGTSTEAVAAQAAPAEPAPAATADAQPAGLPTAGGADVQADGVKPALVPIALKSEPLRTGETLRTRALSLLRDAKSRFGGTTVTNESDGTAIHIPASGLKHAISGSLSPAAVAAVGRVDELVRTAQFTGAEPDRKGRRNVLQARFYERDATFDGKSVRLRVVVRVAPDGSRYYDHFEVRSTEREAEKKDAPVGQSGEPGEPVSIQPFAEASSASPDGGSVPPHSRAEQRSDVGSATDTDASPKMSRSKRALRLTASSSQTAATESQNGKAAPDDQPAAVTRDEATYILGFRDADALRNRATSAARERDGRLRAKGVLADDAEGLEATGPKASGARATIAEEDQALAERIAAPWENKPTIKVVTSIDDPLVPQEVRDEDDKQRSLGAGGDPEGIFHDGTVYLFSDQLRGEADIRRVLMHEALGHYGLHGVFGKELGAVLDRLAVARPADLQAKAEKYGLDLSKPKERRAAAGELLAELAETEPQLGWVRQAVAAIRTWLRAHVPGYRSMKMSDDEIVRNYILPAREWVTKSQQTTISRNGFEDTTPALRHVDGPLFSRSIGGTLGGARNSVRDVNLPAGYNVADLMNRDGKISVWHKTVGTQYNLAQRSPEFKRVFDGVQSFINDTSFYANEAANLAPKILPKLENWKDITKSPISAVDTKALAGPVFDGTLNYARDASGKAVHVDALQAAADGMDAEAKAQALFRNGHLSEQVLKMWQGLPVEKFEAIIGAKYARDMLKPGVVWTDDELRSQFKMTPAQIGLYREFRAATDKSLSSLAVSEMLNLAGDDANAVRQQALDLGDHDKAAILLRDHLFALGEADPARQAVLDETANKVVEIADHATDMQKRGYAPLSRFGTYTLDATLPTGEHYFSLFETTRERAKMARTLAAAGATGVTSGTMSQLDYKLLNGVSPETVALFGDMLGLDGQGSDAKDLAYQTFIKKATANRSALKRLLARKGVAGFSQDAGRVLAGFVYSNGRRTSSNLHSAEITDATAAIAKEGGELKDAAVKLAEYVKNPQEEAQALRGLLFAQYLGGSVASAMVNATQPFTVTFPYLSQFGGVTAAAKQMAAAVKVAGKKTTGDAVLDKALAKAEADGIVSPQEVHQLQAQASGRAALKSGDGTAVGNGVARAQNVLAKTQLAWGKVFGIAEQFNRRVTFIAAYRTAVAQDMADPAAFAAKAVNETQFVYNKGTKAAWARGSIGGVLFTFKAYSVNYLELMNRMWNAGEEGSPERAAGRKAVLLAAAVLFLIGGADGLPFEGDIEDVLDAFMQRLGYNFSSRRAKNEFLAGVLGEDMSRFVNKGLSGLPGAPIDVSGRMGMGNLIPGTGLLTKKADHTSDVAELFGPAGDLGKRAFQAAGQVVDGKPIEAATTLSPVASRNLRKGVDMLQTGSYRDNGGRKVIDTSPAEAVAKMIGFQPNSVARVQEATSEVQQQVAMTRLRQSELSADMAQAVYEKDQAKIEDVRASVRRWNADNPEAAIRLNMGSVLQKVRQMREDKATRIERSSPRGMRAAVRQQLAEAGS